MKIIWGWAPTNKEQQYLLVDELCTQKKVCFLFNLNLALYLGILCHSIQTHICFKPDHSLIEHFHEISSLSEFMHLWLSAAHSKIHNPATMRDSVDSSSWPWMNSPLQTCQWYSQPQSSSPTRLSTALNQDIIFHLPAIHDIINDHLCGGSLQYSVIEEMHLPPSTNSNLYTYY